MEGNHTLRLVEDDLYEVIGSKGSPLTVRLSKDGYERVKVLHNGNFIYRCVHRIIAEMVIPNPKGLAQVNHIDGDKRNNRLSNLEWCTQQDNLRHAMLNGLHPWGMRDVEKFGENGYGVWYPSQSYVKVDGHQQANVNKVIKGVRRSHHGYIWR